MGLWNHNPFHGIGRANDNGRQIYDTPDMGGSMEPHNFARFRQITFTAYYGSRHSIFYIKLEEDYVGFQPESLFRFKAYLRNSRLMKDFVRLLANSAQIDKLNVVMNVGVMLSFPLKPPDIKECLEQHKRWEKEKYGTMLLDLITQCGQLEPLKELSNVKSVELVLTYPSSQGYLKLDRSQSLQDLKETIERNWVERETSRLNV